MVAADGAIAAFTAILTLLYWWGSVETWHVYAILFLRALGAAFHGPAMTASTSLMAPKEQLTRVAGMNQTRQAITRIAVAPLSALLVALLPIQSILAIDILTALLAIGPLLFIAIPQPESFGLHRSDSSSGRRESGGRSVIHEMGDGLRYLWSWRGLFIAITTVSLVFLFQQPAATLIPLLVKRHFGGGAAEWGWTTMAYNVGAVLGGILMSTWGGFRKRVMTMLCGGLLCGVVNLVRGLVPAHALWLFVAVELLAGPAGAMFFVSLKAVLQSTVPPEMQGRVFSLQNSLLFAMGPLGLSVLGPLADVWGIQTLYLLTAATCFAVALVWILSRSVRHLEDGPPEQAPSGQAHSRARASSRSV
jgi:DHA3 family macrolide efflux protein-like MFS transporter